MISRINKLYYYIKPLIPRKAQLNIRRKLAFIKLKRYKDVWPIDKMSNKPPERWIGWPDQKKFPLILTHDVDTEFGQKKCNDLINLEMQMGFVSSFNFVPEGYKVLNNLRNYITKNGFEVGVHGLTHDGKLYSSKDIFDKRSDRINQYIKKWGSVGFRSPAMHCNLEWIQALNIEYDASTFDTDPFEPQPEGVGTIFPFWVRGNGNNKGYVELPYTLPQDFTLFIIMQEKSIDIWKRKLDWIVENGGMALLNVHPDYMNFTGKDYNSEEYPVKHYIDFLEYVKSNYRNNYWNVLPKDIARFWMKNYAI